MPPELARAVGYAVGIAGSIAVIAITVRIDHLLARLLAAWAAGWICACALLLVSAITLAHGRVIPEWQYTFRWVTAIVLGTLPMLMVLGLWWGARNGRT